MSKAPVVTGKNLVAYAAQGYELREAEGKLYVWAPVGGPLDPEDLEGWLARNHGPVGYTGGLTISINADTSKFKKKD